MKFCLDTFLKLNGSANSEPNALWPFTALGPGSQKRMQSARWISRIPVLPRLAATGHVHCALPALFWAGSHQETKSVKLKWLNPFVEKATIYDISDKARMEKIYMNLLPKSIQKKRGRPDVSFSENNGWEEQLWKAHLGLLSVPLDATKFHEGITLLCPRTGPGK